MQLDAKASRDAKERGMQQALDFSGTWAEDIVLEATGWIAIEKARGIKLVTIERFRAEAKNAPPSHKAWGSLPRLLCKAGLIREHRDAHGNPVYRRAAALKTHAHPVKVWEIV